MKGNVILIRKNGRSFHAGVESVIGSQEDWRGVVPRGMERGLQNAERYQEGCRGIAMRNTEEPRGEIS